MQPKTAWPVPDFRTLTGLRVPLHVVDVGANPIDGAPEYSRLLAEGDATLLGFEPNPAALARLEARRGPHETYLGLAVGDGAEHTLHVCAAPGMTSLLRPDPAVLGLFHGFPEWGRVVETRTVRTTRLDDVSEAGGADLLKLDIQGGELMALRYAEALLRELVVVQAEVEFLPLYSGQPRCSRRSAGFMRARGFVLHRFHPPVSRVVVPMVVGGDVFAGAEPAGVGGCGVRAGLLRPFGVGRPGLAGGGAGAARVLRVVRRGAAAVAGA